MTNEKRQMTTGKVVIIRSQLDNPAMLRRLLPLLLLPFPLFAQTTQDKVRDYRRTNERQILKEFTTLLSIPNVAADNENIRKNAAAIMEMMKQRGLSPRLLEGSGPNVPPAVYGEWRTPGAQRTMLVYAHYDGQPTDPKQWTGTLPWQPVFRSAALEAGGQIVTGPTDGTSINPEWRIYSRSASDDKAGVMAILTAFGAYLKHQILFRRRRRGGFTTSGRHYQPEQRLACRRCLDHL
jgi:acetylornithine deacetylase/succinyl-diaminopimelate desuccinylase-like protein